MLITNLFSWFKADRPCSSHVFHDSGLLRKEDDKWGVMLVGGKTALPVELWYYIASFFDSRTLTAVSMTSKGWCTISQDDAVWKSLCKRKFDIGAFYSLSLSWKAFYLTHKLYNGAWDNINMGKILLSRDFKTATHGGDFLGSYQCVRGDTLITSGVCYWEIMIDKLNAHQTGFHVVVGVVPASFNYRHTYLTSNGGWGYLADGRKAHNSGNGEQYAHKYIQGDRVGVLVNLYKNSITFYLNGISQGVAFEDVYGPVYPAVSLLTGGQCASFVRNTSFPSDYMLQRHQPAPSGMPTL